MVYAFDTLGYSKRLREGGVPPAQAEAHAEAVRDFVMAELFTKTDSVAMRQGITADMLAIKQEMLAFKQELSAEIRRLDDKIDMLSMRLTVRLGLMLTGGLAALAAVLKLA